MKTLTAIILLGLVTGCSPTPSITDSNVNTPIRKVVSSDAVIVYVATIDGDEYIIARATEAISIIPKTKK